MKANELMIGDWVLVHKPTCKGHRVDYISEMEEEIGADGEIYDSCDIKPIPLTTEILEKNGFDQNGIGGREIELVDADYSDDTYVWQERDEYDNLFTISIYDLNCGSWQMEIVDSPKGKMDVEIKFVHELQHALRFCKIEKEIVL